MTIRILSTLALIATIVGCGGGGGGSFEQVVPSVTVDPPTITEFSAILSEDAVIGEADSDATATASLSFNVDANRITDVTVMLPADFATAVTLNAGFAGQTGEQLDSLLETSAGVWQVSNVNLTSEQSAQLQSGGLYVQTSNDDNPSDALRGQFTDDSVRVILVELSGSEEVPQVSTDASALAGVTFNSDTSEINLHLTATGVDDATAVHLHQGFAGTNGGVVIGLTQNETDVTEWSATDVLDETGVASLDAAEFYFNLHTPANPGGELRGQVVPEGVEVIFAELSGQQEVPAVSTSATGTVAVTSNSAASTLIVNVNTTGVDDASAAHVHQSDAGTNGPVLISLMQNPDDVTQWTATSELDSDTTSALAAGSLYINVHTPANPGGELRGQIAPDNIEILFAELSGNQEVPSVTTTATGSMAVTLNEANASMIVHINTTGVDDATATHVHQGFAGTNGPVLFGLEQDANDVAHWSATEVLDPDGVAALNDGELYVNVHTPANPGGELRGQIVSEDIELAFADLNGLQEVPAVTTTATGRVAFTLNTETSNVVIQVNTTGVDDATAAHLHQGIAGTNGGVLVGLSQNPDDISRWSATAELDSDGIAAYEGAELYINVHTPANPGGELRGQITPDGTEVIVNLLSGDQEVPAVTTSANGTVAATINYNSMDLTVHVNTSGVDDATAAHVHQAFAGSNGPVLIGLNQDPDNVAHWFADAVLDSAAVTALSAGELYINVHTPANPGGELRGQITPADVVVLFADLSGDQEVPPVTTTATGSVAATFNRTSLNFVVQVNTSGVDDATAAHVHQGAAGTNGAVLIGLTQDADDVSRWAATETLDADGVTALQSDELYINVHTPANPGGELRGQILFD